MESGLAWLTEQALSGNLDQNFFWIGPDYGACATAQNLLKSALTPGSYTIPNRSTAIVLINGVVVSFRNADNTNTLYSDSVFAMVVDQAIHISDRAWKAIGETLANTHAPARILSTVAAKDNWFNELARRAETQQTAELAWYRFTALDALEEGLIKQSDIDYARATLPDHIFRALYLAQPYDDRIEAAHKAGDPKLMSDQELAIIANLDPEKIASISDEVLSRLAESAT